MRNFAPIDYNNAHDYAGVHVDCNPKASNAAIARSVKQALKVLLATNRYTVQGMTSLLVDIKMAVDAAGQELRVAAYNHHVSNNLQHDRNSSEFYKNFFYRYAKARAK